MPTQQFKPKIDPERAYSLYHSGAGDVAMAMELGVTRTGVVHWRKRHGLIANIPACSTPISTKRRLTQALSSGATVAQAARKIGASVYIAREVQRSLKGPNLRKSGISTRHITHQVRRDPGIFGRIAKAIGSQLPEDVRADACSELYVAVLAGEVAVNLIEDYAAQYRSLAWKMSGSLFEQRSIFEEIGEGFCLGDTLEDEHAVQEMEDAVERALEMR